MIERLYISRGRDFDNTIHSRGSDVLFRLNSLHLPIIPLDILALDWKACKLDDIGREGK